MKLKTLHEAYCSACGGSDDDPFTDPTARGFGGKVMRGHRFNCPVGKMGSPIEKQAATIGRGRKPFFIDLAVWLDRAGRLPEWFYDRMKEYGGTVVRFYVDSNHANFVVGFKKPMHASMFVDALNKMVNSGNFRVIVPNPDDYLDEYDSGSVDAEFVREYDIS